MPEIARIGDMDDDDDVIITGSSTVFAGDRSFSSGIARSAVSGGHVVKYTEQDLDVIDRDGDPDVPIGHPDYVDKPEPTPEASDEEEAPVREPVLPGCDDITEATPNSYRLSPNYTLADVSVKGLANNPRKNYNVRAQHGLTKAEIICNMKAVCTNVLEAIRAKYPSSLVVTSGFRPASGRSQHERGQAVDIQWLELNNKARAKEYYERAKWIRDNVPFDQIILEYASRSGYPWIHISFNRQNNRRSILTQRLNGSGFDPGLILRRFT